MSEPTIQEKFLERLVVHIAMVLAKEVVKRDKRIKEFETTLCPMCDMAKKKGCQNRSCPLNPQNNY